MDKEEHSVIYIIDDSEEEEEEEEVVEEVIEIKDDDVECSAESTLTEKCKVLGSTEKALVPPRRDGDTGHEVKNKLEKIGAHLSSDVVENKTRMQSYIKSVVKDCNRNIREHWKVHQEEMREFKIEYTEQIITVFKQWDSDIMQVEDQENEINGIFKHQQKTFQQTRMLQTDSLKTLKQADDEFLKVLEDFEKNYTNVLNSIHNEFQKQKTLLQRKITDG
ncbi:synaptonemal complex protein 3-like [Meriones unguiculatus]|uniref:synaptonemal complex protein 3-like n=1 Tax=Meriones unguiculatus TaxID=10047 RepID=UPI00293E240A|nr:synaptonemal complex protein 3-like [Meriones unguiculatus]